MRFVLSNPLLMGRSALAVLLVSGLALGGFGCGTKDGPSLQGARPTGETESTGVGSGASGQVRVDTATGAFRVFVVPSPPSRIAPPTISVKSPQGSGAEVLDVKWIVNGAVQEGGHSLSPLRFRRGDSIRAVVKLRAGAEEKTVTTEEATAGNALPAVMDVRIEPRTPTNGSTVRAVVHAVDPDEDSLKFKYQWYIDDSPAGDNAESMALKGVKKGAWVHCSVTPNDGTSDGAWKESPRYQVVNTPPVVRSPAPTNVPSNRLLRHTILAEDPDGDPLTFTLSKGPSGMTLSGSTLEWKVPDESIGSAAEAVVTISDNDGGKTIHTFSMTIRKN